MRALVCKEYGPPESLVIEENDDPVAGEGQVVVEVAAAGINFPDVLAIAGEYQVKTPTPFVPGNEAAGVIAAVGAGVTQFAVGDRVIINTTGGAFAEKCVAEVRATAPLPEDLSFEQGAGFSVTYGTSYHALKQSANLQPGETVLVLGAAGGVGITAVEIAKAMGARVIAAASSDEKLEFAISAGADDTINYSKVPLKETVKELTGGQGADVVYDPVGGELADQAFRATAWHGRYLVIGFACGEIPKFAANIALLKEASIIGVWWGTWAARNPKLQIQNIDYVDAFKTITERRALGKVTLRMS
jgi:NADPH2:quinone reductase